jgi:hypothetical protein
MDSSIFPCEHMVANNLDNSARYTYSSANQIMFGIKDKSDRTWTSPIFKFTPYIDVCLMDTQ